MLSIVDPATLKIIGSRTGRARSARGRCIGRRNPRLHLQLRRRHVQHPHRRRSRQSEITRHHRPRRAARTARTRLRGRQSLVHVGSRESRRQLRSGHQQSRLGHWHRSERDAHGLCLSGPVAPRDYQRRLGNGEYHLEEGGPASRLGCDHGSGRRSGGRHGRLSRWQANLGGECAAGDDHIIDVASTSTKALDAGVTGANRLKFTPDGKLVLVSTLAGPNLTIINRVGLYERAEADSGRTRCRGYSDPARRLARLHRVLTGRLCRSGGSQVVPGRGKNRRRQEPGRPRLGSDALTSSWEALMHIKNVFVPS